MRTAKTHSVNESELSSPHSRQQNQCISMGNNIRGRRQSGVTSEHADPAQYVSDPKSGKSYLYHYVLYVCMYVLKIQHEELEAVFCQIHLAIPETDPGGWMGWLATHHEWPCNQLATQTIATSLNVVMHRLSAKYRKSAYRQRFYNIGNRFLLADV